MTIDELKQAHHAEVECLLAEIERLRQEIEDWKDRCIAAEETLQATIKHCDDMLKEIGL